MVEQNEGKEGKLEEKEEKAGDLVNYTATLLPTRLPFPEGELTLAWPSSRVGCGGGGPD